MTTDHEKEEVVGAIKEQLPSFGIAYSFPDDPGNAKFATSVAGACTEAALAADPLRRALGVEAVNAILEGRAAVIRLEEFIEDTDCWWDTTRVIMEEREFGDRVDCELADVRLDRPLPDGEKL